MCHWIPVDSLADIILELSNITEEEEKPETSTEASTCHVYNAINPDGFHWSEELLPALRQMGLEFKALPPAEWVRQLEQSDPDPTRNPTIKLLSFLQARYANSKQDPENSTSQLTFSTVKAQTDSKTLCRIPPIVGSGMVGLFLKSWRMLPSTTPDTVQHSILDSMLPSWPLSSHSTMGSIFLAAMCLGFWVYPRMHRR